MSEETLMRNQHAIVANQKKLRAAVDGQGNIIRQLQEQIQSQNLQLVELRTQMGALRASVLNGGPTG